MMRERSSQMETPGILLSVIIPVYNEEKHLLSLAEALSVRLDETVGRGEWEFVFVNNGSTDGSDAVISAIAARLPACVCSVYLERPDYGNALRRGLRDARGEWAWIINVDFWDPVFLAWAWHHRQRYDLMIGSKRADPTLDERQKYRRILSWGLNVILQGYFGLVATDTHGQKVMHLRTLRPLLEVCVMSRGQFDTEFTIRSQRAGLRLAEFPVPIVETRKQRNLMLKKIKQNVIDIFLLKRVLRNVPFSGGVHYHRYSRDDYPPAGTGHNERHA
jgi:glycosyltransferase involved in cell wall biosynthesis